jgi:hypothetical protein
MVGCTKEAEETGPIPAPFKPQYKTQTTVSITDANDSVPNAPKTRLLDANIEFDGGYATGAGYYDGNGQATVSARAKPGYRLVSFTGGRVGGNPNEKSDQSSYTFDVDNCDWKFKVEFEIDANIVIGKDIMAVGGDWYSITHGNRIFLAAAKGKVKICPDNTLSGINWVIHNGVLGDMAWVYDVVYGNGKYIVVGSPHSDNMNKAFFSTSTDGITWRRSDYISDGEKPWKKYKWRAGHSNSIIYAQNKFIAACNHEDYDKNPRKALIATSTDGEHWTREGYANESGSPIRILFANGSYVMVTSSGHACTSTNLKDWNVSRVYSSRLNDVCYGNGKYICISDFAAFLSTDGTNWKEISIPTTIKNMAKRIIYKNNRFIISLSDKYIVSVDGENWTMPKDLVDIQGNILTESPFRCLYPIN